MKTEPHETHLYKEKISKASTKSVRYFNNPTLLSHITSPFNSLSSLYLHWTKISTVLLGIPFGKSSRWNGLRIFNPSGVGVIGEIHQLKWLVAERGAFPRASTVVEVVLFFSSLFFLWSPYRTPFLFVISCACAYWTRKHSNCEPKLTLVGWAFQVSNQFGK